MIRASAFAVLACSTLLVSATVTPLSAQQPSAAESVRAQMLKRAKGIGEAEKKACRNSLAQKLGDNKIKLIAFTQELDLVTYIQAGGWRGRTGIPRYQTTLVIMRAPYAHEGANIFGGKGNAVCVFNREGGRLRFIVSCVPGRDLCHLPG